MAIYHRLKSPTQTEQIARLQQSSGEIWGKRPFQWDRPAVEAYRGPLPAGRDGIEFESDAEPDGEFGYYVVWSVARAGVWFEGEYAKIRVRVTTVRYTP